MKSAPAREPVRITGGVLEIASEDYRVDALGVKEEVLLRKRLAYGVQHGLVVERGPEGLHEEVAHETKDIRGVRGAVIVVGENIAVVASPKVLREGLEDGRSSGVLVVGKTPAQEDIVQVDSSGKDRSSMVSQTRRGMTRALQPLSAVETRSPSNL